MKKPKDSNLIWLYPKIAFLCVLRDLRGKFCLSSYLVAGLLVASVDSGRAQASADDYYYAAIGMMAQSKDAEAIQYFEATLKLDPNHVKAWKKMAEAQKNIGEYRAAISSLEKALSLAPDDPDIPPLLQDLRPLATASTSADKGLAAAGEAEKPIQFPGFSFTIGTGLNTYRDGDLANHLNTSFFFLRNANWLQRVGGYKPKNTVFGKDTFAPTFHANFVSDLAAGQIDRPNLGLRIRAEAAGRKRINDSLYLKFGGSATYHLFEESGYEAKFGGGLVDEGGNILGANPAGPDPAIEPYPEVRVSERWRGGALVIGVGPSLGLSDLDIDENVLINYGSLGIDFLVGLGSTRYSFEANSKNLNGALTLYEDQASVKQSASLTGLGMGFGVSLELVKNVVGIPVNLRFGRRWLKIGPMRGTFESEDDFTGNSSEPQDVVAVVVSDSSVFNGTYFEWGDSIYFLQDGEDLPDGTRHFRIDLSGFEFEASVRIGF